MDDGEFCRRFISKRNLISGVAAVRCDEFDQVLRNIENLTNERYCLNHIA
jgi:hypothetical protein